MKTSNIHYSFLNESDIEAVNHFHNRIYGDNRTTEKFIWEFFHGPCGKAIYVIAKDTTTRQIIGTQCAIPLFLSNMNGEKTLTAKSEDTLIDPEYRGQKIFENMYKLLFDECKKNGINYIWGFTSASKPFRKIGFDTPFSHSQSLLVNNIKNSYFYLSSLNPKNTNFDKLKILGLIIFSKIKSFKLFLQKTTDISNYILKAGDQSEIDSLNPLFQSSSSGESNNFFIYQDRDYLNWRIKNNPYSRKLYNFSFFRNDNMVANIILSLHNHNVWYLVHSIFCADIPEKHKLQMFAKSIRFLYGKEKPVLIRSWNFQSNPLNNSEILLLRKSGFVHINKGIYFVWKTLIENAGLVPENFHLSRMATQGVI